jgi:hypothetical protein
VAGFDQAGNDRAPQAAGAARDEDWRCHAFPLTFGPARAGAGYIHWVSLFYDGSRR